MENTVKQRIMKFIETIGSNPSAFERYVGLSNGYLNSLRNSPSPSKIEDILNAYPQINRIWLLTGEGEMIVDGVSMKQQPGRHGSDISYLLRLIEDHDIRFHELANRILDGMGVASTQKEKIA